MNYWDIPADLTFINATSYAVRNPEVATTACRDSLRLWCASRYLLFSSSLHVRAVNYAVQFKVCMAVLACTTGADW